MSDDNFERETFDDLRREIRSGAARDALNALRHVCQDPKATAQAKATAGSTLFRAAGLLDRYEEPDAEKPTSEMTPEELERAVKRALVNQEIRVRERAAGRAPEQRGSGDPAGEAGTVFY
jgi:hypothetical protein